MLNNIIECIYC